MRRGDDPHGLAGGRRAPRPGHNRRDPPGGRRELAVTAETADWAWIRIPSDPYWHSQNGTPVLKGGPGHIVAWVNEGQNNFGWWVPREVDMAAIATTAAAAALASVLLIAARRRGRQNHLGAAGAPPAAEPAPADQRVLGVHRRR